MPNRRDFLKTVGGVGFLAALGTGIVAGTSRKPNIVLCMADDQGWGDMAYNGHPLLQTPNFDTMAATGLRFDRFYAAAPVCSPTRGSVMTGRHPNRFGCFSWGLGLRPQEITIAEALKKAGYVTGHFGKWHLGSVFEGSPVNPGASGFDEWLSSPNFFDNNPILSREGKAVPIDGESSMVTVDAAIGFMRKHAASTRPFLAVVWFGSPHAPHEALESDRALYRGHRDELQHFLGEITAMDRAFGKLRQELRDLGIHENTILWYCSDNGGLPEVGATGGRGHKGMIYDGGLRVPAMLEWPSVLCCPRVTDIPCSSSDIYPTLLEIVGARVQGQPPLDGISLVPLIRGKAKSRRKPLGFWDYPVRGIVVPSKAQMAALLQEQNEGKELGDKTLLRSDAGKIAQEYPDNIFPGHAAWLDWPWKFHRIEKDGNLKFELYKLDEDPEEQSDLSSAQARQVRSMRSALEKWQKSVVRSLNGEDY